VSSHPSVVMIMQWLHVVVVLLMFCISQAFMVAPSFQTARTKLSAHDAVQFGGLQHAGVLVRDTEASTVCKLHP
jgi:cytochrome c-type biogenesis protein CcmE